MNNYFKYNSTTVAITYDTPVISVDYKFTTTCNLHVDVNRLLNVISDNVVNTDDISGLSNLVKITESEFNELRD